MSPQKCFFDINQSIGFGKYSPMCIADIYSGSEDFPITWYQQELQEALLLFKPLGYPYSKFFDISFDNTRLKIKLNDTYNKYRYFEGVYLDTSDCQRELNKLLTERYQGICECAEGQEVISYSDEYFERLEREEMLRLEVKVDFEDTTKNFFYEAFVLKCGKPNYISWLIQNVDFFSLSPSCIKELEGCNINTFLGMWLKKVDENTLEPFIDSSKRKEIFSEYIKKLNSDKWARFCKENKHLFRPVDYKRNEFRDDTRLGFGGDDDEDSIMRGLGSGNGDLFGF